MMQRVEIDCRTGQAVYIDLSSDEESALLTEIEVRKVEQARQDKKVAKRVLVSKLTELREMRQNKQIFTDEDIAEKQAEIDELTGRL